VSDILQAVAYNPMQQVLASIATTDFGIWSKEVKQVQKTKLPSRGLCCSWTSDGTVCLRSQPASHSDASHQVLAIGLFGGDILIYDRTWGEKDLKVNALYSERSDRCAFYPSHFPDLHQAH
jgi:intraflagellar transport protein 122